MVHVHAWHMWHVSAQASLARTVYAGSRVAGDGGGKRKSVPSLAGRRAAAAGGGSRDSRVICAGRSGW